MRWEYKVVKLGTADREMLEATLNNWGEEGWELVATFPQPEGHTLKVVAVFKSVTISKPSLETRLRAR